MDAQRSDLFEKKHRKGINTSKIRKDKRRKNILHDGDWSQLSTYQRCMQCCSHVLLMAVLVMCSINYPLGSWIPSSYENKYANLKFKGFKDFSYSHLSTTSVYRSGVVLEDVHGQHVTFGIFYDHITIVAQVDLFSTDAKKHFDYLKSLYDKYHDENGVHILVFPCVSDRHALTNQEAFRFMHKEFNPPFFLMALTKHTLADIIPNIDISECNIKQYEEYMCPGNCIALINHSGEETVSYDMETIQEDLNHDLNFWFAFDKRKAHIEDP